MPSPGQVIADASRAPGGIANQGNILDSALNEILDTAGQAWASSREGAAAVELEEMTAGLLAFSSFDLLMVVLAALIGSRILERYLVSLLSPVPFVGGRLVGVVHTLYSPLDNLEAWTANKAGQVVGNIFHAIIGMVAATVRVSFPHVTNTTIIVKPSDIQTLQDKIDYLQATVNHQGLEIRNLQAHVYGTQAQSTPGLTTIEDRVSRLEQGYTVIGHDLSVLHEDVVSLDHYVRHLDDVVSGELQNLHAVRAVQFGVQDVLRQVQQTTSQLQAQMVELFPTVETHTAALDVLKPLDGLLYMGSAGIKTLQKLEENPCQCPSLGDMGGPFWDALILEQVMANGV